ncbi:MAG: hypothetical protein EP343_18880 [Deltaproteobacteria bacterium]|nr:MAG: hypothetical protein EP343_18880 [Deltaproteobacteria bacterium]
MTAQTQSPTRWSELGECLRHPEATALRWFQRNKAQDTSSVSSTPSTLSRLPSVGLFTMLVGYIVVGMAAYGFAMHMHKGTEAMLQTAWLLPSTFGVAWLLASPSLYIINTALGSELDLSTTLLVLLITLGLGSLAMLTLVPIHWFFSITLHHHHPQYWIRVASLVLVGLCMTDVFLRIMRTLEPKKNPAFAIVWILLVSLISFEMSSLTFLGSP